MEITRHATPLGLLVAAVVILLVAWVWELTKQEDPRGNLAEAKRIQDRMKAYQDRWEQSRCEQKPQGGGHQKQ